MPKWRQVRATLPLSRSKSIQANRIRASRLSSAPVRANRSEPGGFPLRTCISTLYASVTNHSEREHAAGGPKRRQRCAFRESSPYLGELCFGLRQDGNVGVGVFPESEEFLIRRARFRSIALQGIGTGEPQASECSQRKVDAH